MWSLFRKLLWLDALTRKRLMYSGQIPNRIPQFPQHCFSLSFSLSLSVSISLSMDIFVLVLTSRHDIEAPEDFYTLYNISCNWTLILLLFASTLILFLLNYIIKIHLKSFPKFIAFLIEMLCIIKLLFHICEIVHVHWA